MVKKTLPSPEELRQLLRYEPATGKLFWMPRDRHHFSTNLSFATWNSRYAGGEALSSLNDKKYRCGAVKGIAVSAHRVIWAIFYGAWPKCGIDHVNGDRSDNRICNLRLASKSENAMNIGIRSDNKSGFKGVNKRSKNNKWVARIGFHGRRIFLGEFDTPELAYAAYCEASKDVHGEFSRLS